MKIGINCYIDVSGNPYEKIVIGLATFNPDTANKIAKDFRKLYPQFSKAKIKGSKLNASDLKTIISFLDSQNVHMYSLVFDDQDWMNYKKIYGARAHFKEKVFAVLYFLLLREFARQRYKYPVTVCKENFMDIEKVIDCCKRLAEANKYDFDFSIAYAKSNELLKFADFVASACRKCEHQRLKSFANFHKIKVVIPKFYLDKMFE